MTYASSTAKTLAAIALFASATSFSTAQGMMGVGRMGGSDDQFGETGTRTRGSMMGQVVARRGGANGKGNAYADKRDRETGVELKNDGTAVLRGAKVTAISASTATVTETLGPVTLTWTATLTGSTKLEARNGSTLGTNDILVGDTVTIKGTLQSGNTYALTATLVRDVTKVVPTTPAPVATNQQQIVEGVITATPGSAAPTLLTLAVGSTTYTVTITTTTTVLNTAWAPLPLASFQTNDRVRVFGYIPSGSTAVTALVVRNTTR